MITNAELYYWYYEIIDNPPENFSLAEESLLDSIAEHLDQQRDIPIKMKTDLNALYVKNRDRSKK